MKFSKIIFAALLTVLFAEATTTPVDQDKSPVHVQEADPTEVLSDMLNLMLDTLEKKKKSANKNGGKIDVITGVTAHVDTGKDPYQLTPEELDFITEVLLDSYNCVHAADDYDGFKLDLVSDGLDDDDEDVSAAAVAEGQRLLRGGRARSFRAWYRFSFNYGCNFCGDDAVVASSKDGVIDPQAYLQKKNKVHKEWEDLACSKLQAGPFDAFKNAKGLVIELDHEIHPTYAQA